MREIKFRGKHIETGRWVYGYYVCTHNRHRIIYEDYEGFYCEEEVIPETVGQYTGLKDKNGKEIYEGDIILFNNFGDTLDKVVYSSGCFHTSGRGYLLDKIREIEVIGNIYENPELLEEKRTLSKRWSTE